jgi:hypothetical protein
MADDFDRVIDGPFDRSSEWFLSDVSAVDRLAAICQQPVGRQVQT